MKKIRVEVVNDKIEIFSDKCYENVKVVIKDLNENVLYTIKSKHRPPYTNPIKLLESGIWFKHNTYNYSDGFKLDITDLDTSEKLIEYQQEKINK